MTLAQVRDVADQAARRRASRCVYFEGGEPTLDYPVMVAGARYARELGPRLRRGHQLPLGRVGRRRAALARAVRGAGLADFSLSSYAYFTEDHERRSSCATPCVAAQRLGLPMGVLEVGAPAAARRPGRRLRRTRRDHVQGAGGVALAHRRAPDPPARHAHDLPATKTSPPPTRPRGLRRQPAALPGHQRRQPAGAAARAEIAGRDPGERRAAPPAPRRPPCRRRDPARRAARPCPRQRPRTAAPALCRPVSPAATSCAAVCARAGATAAVLAPAQAYGVVAQTGRLAAPRHRATRPAREGHGVAPLTDPRRAHAMKFGPDVLAVVRAVRQERPRAESGGLSPRRLRPLLRAPQMLFMGP